MKKKQSNLLEQCLSSSDRLHSWEQCVSSRDRLLSWNSACCRVTGYFCGEQCMSSSDRLLSWEQCVSSSDRLLSWEQRVSSSDRTMHTFCFGIRPHRQNVNSLLRTYLKRTTHSYARRRACYTNYVLMHLSVCTSHKQCTRTVFIQIDARLLLS